MVVKYKEEFINKIITLGEEGKTKTQMAAYFKITPSTLLKWSRDPDKPEFREAYEIAQIAAQAYMEDIGIKLAKGLFAKGNAPAWIFQMKARYRKEYGETDLTKIELNNVKTLSDQELTELITSLAAKKKKLPPDPSSNNVEIS